MFDHRSYTHSCEIVGNYLRYFAYLRYFNLRNTDQK